MTTPEVIMQQLPITAFASITEQGNSTQPAPTDAYFDTTLEGCFNIGNE